MAFGWDDGIALAGGVASLLSGGGGDAAREAARYRSLQGNNLMRQEGVLNDIAGLRDNSRNSFLGFNDDALSALREYTEFLRSPQTDEQYQASLARALNGVDADYNRGITNSLAANALAGTPISSRTTGDILDLTDRRNRTIGNVRSDLNLYDISNRERRLGSMASLLNNARSQFLGETTGANSALYGGFGNIANQYGAMAGGAQQRADNAGFGQSALYGSMASYIPGLFNSGTRKASPIGWDMPNSDFGTWAPNDSTQYSFGEPLRTKTGANETYIPGSRSYFNYSGNPELGISLTTPQKEKTYHSNGSYW